MEENQHEENQIESRLNHITSRKMAILISSVVLVCLLFTYIGSYCYMRNKVQEVMECVRKKPNNPRNLPKGYVLEISFGVGIGGGGPLPPRGARIYAYSIGSNDKPTFCKWPIYLYYPLIWIEVKFWRLKTFGYKELFRL